MNRVPSVNDRNPVSWRLLVKEQITNIGKLRTHFFVFLLFKYKSFFVGCFWSLPNVDSGGVSKVAVAISVICDRGYFTHDM